MESGNFMARDSQDRDPHYMSNLTGENFKVLCDNIQVGIVLIDADTHEIVDLNTRAQEMIGCERDEILGHECHEFICPAKHGQCPISDLHQIIDNSERTLLTFAGKNVPILKTVKKIEIDGHPYILDSFVDLSDHKATQNALWESEDKQKIGQNQVNLILKTAQDGFWLVDASNGHLVDVNEASSSMLGYTREELMARGLTDIDAQWSSNEIGVQMQRIKAIGNALFETRHHTKDGHIIDVEISVNYMASTNQFFSFIRNITERKKTEETLRESEEKWRSVVENAPNIIMTLDRNCKILFINYTVPGISLNDVLGSDAREYLQPEYKEILTKAIEEVFQTRKPTVYEVSGTGPCGELAYYSTRIGPIMEEGKVVAAMQIVTDITEQKKTNEAMRESEEKFRTMMANSADAVFIADANGNFTYTNPKASEMLGYSAEEFIKMNIKDISREEGMGKPLRKFQQLLQTGKLFTELSLLKKDGSIILTELNAVVMENKGIYGSCRDITERKKTEEALRESEERFRSVFESSKDAIMTLEPPSWNFTSGNPATLNMFGASNLEEFIACGPANLSPELQLDGSLSAERAKEMIEIALRDGTNFFEWTYKRIKGEEFLVNVLLTRVKQNEKEYLHATVRDISESKQMEIELRESEERFRSIMNESVDTVFITDRQGNYTYVNPTGCKMLGYEQDELINMNITQISTKKDLEADLKAFQVLLETGKLSYELDLVKKDRTIIPTDLNAVVMENGLIYGSCRDITERKRAEEALRESEEKYRTLIQGTHEIIQSVTLDGKFLFVNKTWHDLLGYSKEELKQKTLFDIIHPDSLEHCSQLFNEVMSGKSLTQVEVKFKTKEGSTIYVEGNVIPRYSEGRLIGTQGFFRDITGRKKMEAELKANLHDLERYKKATVDRELKMIELKERNKQLEQKGGAP